MKWWALGEPLLVVHQKRRRRRWAGPLGFECPPRGTSLSQAGATAPLPRPLAAPSLFPPRHPLSRDLQELGVVCICLVLKSPGGF